MNAVEQPDTQWNAAAKILLAVSVVGALNWGLVGFFNYNLVTAVFGVAASGGASAASRVVYGLIGLAGLIAMFVTPWGSSRVKHAAHFGRRARADSVAR